MTQVVDNRTAFSQLMLSGLVQVDADTAQPTPFAFQLSEDSQAKLVWDAETNEAERTGTTEATDVDINRITSEATLTQEKLTPNFLLWIGGILSQPIGTAAAVGTGYLTKCDFVAGEVSEGPYFTIDAQDGRAWNQGLIAGGPARHKRFKGMAIDSIELGFTAGEFATGSVGAIGTGAHDDAFLTEVVSGNFTAFTFTASLSAYSGLSGGAGTADRVNRITAMADLDDDGIFEYKLSVTALSVNTYTFADPGVSGTHNVTITFAVDWTEAGFEWIINSVAVVPLKEVKFKAQHIRVHFNASFDSGLVRDPTVTEFSGCELRSFSWSLNFNREAQGCWRKLVASSDDHAARVERGDVIQRAVISREIIDYMMAQHISMQTTFGIEVDLVGPEWDATGDPGNKWEARLILPRCKVINPDQAIDNGKHQDEIEVAVLAAGDGSANAERTMSIWVQNLNNFFV